ncbi:MAG: tetratricopeptide repeat protein [Proteobacteria bacterium]|nr:tetratricopeptide repeat protein [Pseudomonadota bacterium]
MDKGWQHNYDCGRKAFDEQRYDLALLYLEKVASEKNTYADVYNMLGLIYYNNGRLSDAASAFNTAIELNPNYTEASLSLTVVYNDLGRFDKSKDAYMLARQSRQESDSYLDPYVKGRLANMHASLGVIYKDLGIYSQAVDEFKKALDLRPDFIDIKTELGSAYRDMKDFSNSIRVLTEAVELNAEHTTPRVQLGLTYYTMGENESARQEWSKVLKEHPEDPMASMYMTLLNAPSNG